MLIHQCCTHCIFERLTSFSYTHWRVLVLSKNSCDDSSFLCIGCHHALVQVLGKHRGEVIHVLKTKRYHKCRQISYLLEIY